MPHPPAVRRRPAGGLAALGALGVVLLVLPGAVSATPSFSKSFRPPFPGGQVTAYSLGWSHVHCASTSVPTTAAFNLTRGRFAVNASANVTACPPLRSAAGYGGLAGEFGPQFTVPSNGTYRYSFRWTGSLWANLSVQAGGSPARQFYANYSVWVSSEVWCVLNRTVASSETTLVRSLTLHNGSRSVRVGFGTYGPFPAPLRSGQRYWIVTTLAVRVDVTSGPRSSMGARASSAIASGPGVSLAFVTIA